MEYIEYMSNLRYALEQIRNIIPEIISVAQMKADLERNQEIDILLMPDAAWDILQQNYLDVEEKVFAFDPEFEYGAEPR